MVTGKPKIVEKSWGRELWLANDMENDYCSKILEIRHSGSTHMHFHLLKHETFYVMSGSLYLSIIDTRDASTSELVIAEGQTIKIPRGQPHKLEARYQDVKVIETSTYHRDGDSYRVSR